MTQTQIGKLVGTPRSQLSRIEKIPDRTSVRQLHDIATALNLPVGDILN